MRSLYLLPVSATVACGLSEGGGDSSTAGPDLVDCGYSMSATAVPIEGWPDAELVLALLTGSQPRAATWWDGATTEFVLDLDTSVVTDVERLDYLFEPDTSAPGAGAADCKPYEFWRFDVPVRAAGTADGGVTSAQAAVQVVCATGASVRPAPEPGLPEVSCTASVRFEAAVDVAADRLPAGVEAPFVAIVIVPATEGGAFVANVVPVPAETADDASGPDPRTGAGTAEAPSIVGTAGLP